MHLTDTQKNLVILFTLILGCAIIGIGVFTNCRFLHSLPPVPDLTVTPARSVETIKLELDNYKSLVTIVKDNQTLLNDLLVIKFLKGLFDSLVIAIIAYLFGKPVVEALAARIRGNK
jgi:ABC-type glycerol-3-phosphate transport system permease component